MTEFSGIEKHNTALEKYIREAVLRKFNGLCKSKKAQDLIRDHLPISKARVLENIPTSDYVNLDEDSDGDFLSKFVGDEEN